MAMASGSAIRAAHGPTSSLSRTTTHGSTSAPSPNPFPVVTYRHLLSAGSLTPSNPLRVVAHCDVDAAYAQFEAARLGIDSFAVPLAVQQWQGLIAIGYKAREFGINRHCDVQKAKELCPDLVKVHVQTIAPGDGEPAYHTNPQPATHKVSLDPYRRESRKILATFKATCPLGQVEKASIDESYFDLTLEVRKLLLTRYPHLKTPPKTGRGMDEPLPAPPLVEWEDCGALMPTKELDANGNPKSEEESIHAPEHQLVSPTWTDVALAHGAVLMTKVRRAVLSQLGYSTSAGIASNKTLAKLCSGYRKPNNQTTLLPRAVPAFLRDLPVSKIRFLGGKLGREIGDLWDATTVGDLWNVPLESMQAHFGPEAAWVHAVLRGIDHSPVSARITNKTMLASKNLRPFIRKRQEALGWLETLSTELVARLREIWEDERSAEEEGGMTSAVNRDEETSSSSNIVIHNKAQHLIPTLWPKFLVLRFIRARGEGPRSRQAAFPYVSNLTSADVLKVAEKLWNEACDEMKLGVKPAPGSAGDSQPVEVVTISLGFSGLERAEAGQKTIEGFFGGKRKRKEDEDQQIGSTADGIDQSQCVRWSCDECAEVISVTVPEWSSTTEFEAAAGPDREGQEDAFFDDQDPFQSSEKHRVGSTEAEARHEAQQRLVVQVQDHKDWHFAVKLSAQDWQDSNNGPSTSSGFSTAPPLPSTSGPNLSRTLPAKKKAKKGSLQSFFAKKEQS